MTTPRYDKNSCLVRLRKTAIQECDVCSNCREIQGITKAILKKQNIPWTGICERLENGIQALHDDEENIPLCRPKRSTASKINRYTAEPAGKSKMRNSFNVPPQKRGAPPKRPPLLDQLTGNEIYKVVHTNSKIHAQFYQALAKENPAWCLPRPGLQSKAAKSRRRQATLQVTFEAMEMLQGGPQMPSAEKERLVAEAIGVDRRTRFQMFEQPWEASRELMQQDNSNSPKNEMEEDSIGHFSNEPKGERNDDSIVEASD